MTFVYEASDFSSSKRSILSWPIAMAVTSGLFLTMQSLLPSGDVQITNDKPRVFVDVFVAPPIAKPRQIDRVSPPPKAEPIPDELPPPPIDVKGDATVIPLTPPTVITRDDPFRDIDLGMADGEAIPLVRVTPQYPTRAQNAGIEGWVMVRFDVLPSGEVSNPVVEAAEPSGIFNRAALKAIAKFRFKPKVVDGRAVPYSGVRYRFQFSLQD